MRMLDRRELLKAAGAAGGASMAAALGGIAARAADVSGYKALVCVFLRGGMDGHDTLLPYDAASHARYSEIRRPLMNDYASLAGGSTRTIARLLALGADNQADFGSRAFALPPEMSALHQLFEAGRAAVVANVGPLVTPINREQFRAGTVATPKRLFSHNDQQSTWMALRPEGVQFGWGGRFADAAIAGSANLFPVFTAISVSGNDVFLSGERAAQYQLGSNGVATVRELSQPGLLGSGRNSALAQSEIAAHFRGEGLSRSNLFERDVVAVSRRALDANERVATATASAQPLQTTFPDTSLGRQLRTIAETIGLRGALGAGRQVFFAAIGGFDTHSNQAFSLPGLQRQISEAVAAFYAATEELSVANDVTLFTASDFGRTLAVNGDGTDHGWGGNHFVVGGAVNGRRIFGAPPPYDLGHDLDSGSGRVIPTTSIEQFAWPLGRWFGLNDAELRGAFPLIGNFGVPPAIL